MNHAKVAATALEACMALGRPPSSDWFNKDYEILRKFAELLAAEVGIAQYQRGYEEGKAFERDRICKIVYGMCISDNNAFEIVQAIKAVTAKGASNHDNQGNDSTG